MTTVSLIGIVLVAALIFGIVLDRPAVAEAPPPPIQTFDADNKNIQYVGRIDFTDPKKPRFWAPGVYIKARFKGTSCTVLLNDQILWGTSHNYVEIAVDDQPPVRVQTTGPVNVITAATGLADGVHSITICKDTEAGIGYLEFVGLRCEGLDKMPRLTSRKIEFIGDSITCGSGIDLSGKKCGKGTWYDQHNAYMSYGPTVARALDAQWMITAVSGIGLIHSCCDNKFTMPDVYDKIDLKIDSTAWDFKRYQPDVVTICLGQNDGIDKPDVFCNTYVTLLRSLRKVYPKAQFVLMNTPMGDNMLAGVMKDNIQIVANNLTANGDDKVHTLFLPNKLNDGCTSHPSLAQHQIIANVLTPYLKSLMNWDGPPSSVPIWTKL